ncbi:hypothetical protein [Sodalis sp.]|uniref:hypothetical protein n=1 Tax=Sodalis sp. (in: enterobacteria) TaxID=1898979 RepID=UPI003873253F
MRIRIESYDQALPSRSRRSVDQLNIAALNGKVILQVPAAFVYQSREDTIMQRQRCK